MQSAILIAILELAVTTPVLAHARQSQPRLRSESVVVRFADTGEVVLRKNADVSRPIASVTKLLSGLILARLPINKDQVVTVCEDDKDRLKWSRSHLRIGFSAPWEQLAQVAVGASENRAMNAAVRVAMPAPQFVALMNETARELGMVSSHFVEPTGIDPANTSTATDLLQLLAAGAANERLCSWAQSRDIELKDARGALMFHNPDRLVHVSSWEVVIGKTGYIMEAGRNLVVRVNLAERPVDMVFLGSREMASVFGDASRVREWLQPQLTAAVSVSANLATKSSSSGEGGGTSVR